MRIIGAGTVGVVVAARNSVEVLDQALGSIATQTVPVDEVVVVDDCSDDDTAACARRWSAVLPLRVHETGSRLGLWGGRRAGIAELTTDLVLQLDADDMFAPHHVEEMLAAYRRQPGLVSPRPLTWTGRGPWRPAEYAKGRFPLPGDQLAQLLCTNYVLVGAMYPRNLYEEVGGYRETRFGEDWDLWLRLVAAGAVVSKPDDATYVYRVRAAGYSLFDKDVAETEVLDRFLAECADPGTAVSPNSRSCNGSGPRSPTTCHRPSSLPHRIGCWPTPGSWPTARSATPTWGSLCWPVRTSPSSAMGPTGSCSPGRSTRAAGSTRTSSRTRRCAGIARRCGTS